MNYPISRRTAPALPGASEVSGKLLSGWRQAPRALFEVLAAWQRRSEERRQLRQLTDRQLLDMGLSREAAEEMARRAVWSRRV